MWTVTFYQAWNEVNMTFPSYDAAMAFIEDTGVDPDEYDVVEDEDEPIIRHPVSFGWRGFLVIVMSRWKLLQVVAA